MFGELGDLDICGSNRGGGFDDPSDESYSFDSQSDAAASISDDYIDTFESETENNKQNIVQPQNNVNNGGSSAQNVRTEAPQAKAEIRPEMAQKSGNGMIFLAVLIMLGLAAVGLTIYKKNMSQDLNTNNVQEMGDYFYDKAAGESVQNESLPQNQDGMATVDVDLAVQQPQQETAEQKPEVNSNAQQKDNGNVKKFDTKTPEKPEKKSTIASVVIPVSSGGRLDPFYPFNEASKAKALANRGGFDIIAPPLELPEPDPVIDRLMEVKVTGIMYDSIRPSAIIIVDGNEQLVHKGDMVMDYKIMNITPKKVVMKYKANIYEVSAGETFQFDGVNLNPVSSLSKQFGGTYTNSPKNTIQF